MIKVILPAAILSLMMCSGAFAAPSAAGSQLTAPSDVVQIKKEGKGDHGNRHGWGDDDWRDHEAYGPGDRYRNWHHYAYRPDDWDDRGCIAVGPLWYCP